MSPTDPVPDPDDPTPDPDPDVPTSILVRDVPAPPVLHRDAPVTAADPTTRTVTARFVTYNDAHDVVDVDPAGRRHAYRETHAPGSIVPASRLYVRDSHDGALVGHVTATRDEPDGLYGDLAIADTAAGRDLLALVDAGTVGAVSMEFQPDGEVWNPGHTAVTRTRSHLFGVAFAFRPAHDAPILAVRDLPATATAVDTLEPTPTITATPATDDLDALRREVVALGDVMRDRAAATGTHPLARFRSLDDYATAVWEDATLARALTNQITTDNPGVVPPGWLSTIAGIVDRGRPAITALGGQRALPDSGMDINWPYFDGDLSTIVAAQATEKTGITTVKVSFKRGTEAIETYAGGSDISYQLIRRSSPSYREAYLRVLAAAYAVRTETVFEAYLLAAATGTVAFDFTAAMTDAKALKAALFVASGKVRTATGSPATVVLASPDQFAIMGSLPDLYPPAYGTTNVAGTSQASTLRINVSGLEVTEAPYLAAKTILVTNEEAAAWYGDGPFTVTAEDIERLGQDVAVWGMGTGVALLPAGIVKFFDATP